MLKQLLVVSLVLCSTVSFAKESKYECKTDGGLKFIGVNNPDVKDGDYTCSSAYLVIGGSLINGRSDKNNPNCTTRIWDFVSEKGTKLTILDTGLGLFRYKGKTDFVNCEEITN